MWMNDRAGITCRLTAVKRRITLNSYTHSTTIRRVKKKRNYRTLTHNASTLISDKKSHHCKHITETGNRKKGHQL